MPKDGIDGDWGVPATWETLLDNGDAIMQTSSAVLAEEVLDFTFERFRTQTDPYGKRWKPKKRPDGRLTLHGPTHQLKSGWHIERSDKTGFIIAPSVDYAAHHQDPKKGKGGKLKRPRRRMVPTSADGIPPELERRLEEAAAELFAMMFSAVGGGGGGGHMTFVARKIAGVRRRLNIHAIVRRVARGNDT